MAPKTINIFSRHPREVGDEIILGNRETGDYERGRVVGKCEDDPRYQNQHPSPDRNITINTGRDYYRVEVEE